MATDVIGRGLRFPLVAGPHGSLETNSGTERLEQSMRLILTTYPGERPMRPEFGSLLRDHVFGLLNDGTLADLALDVRTALTRWEPRVDIVEVHARPSRQTTGLLLIDITYEVLETGAVRTMELPFERLPGDGEG